MNDRVREHLDEICRLLGITIPASGSLTFHYDQRAPSKFEMKVVGRIEPKKQLTQTGR